jgi:hypothetical protein
MLAQSQRRSRACSHYSLDFCRAIFTDGANRSAVRTDQECVARAARVRRGVWIIVQQAAGSSLAISSGGAGGFGNEVFFKRDVAHGGLDDASAPRVF